MIVSFGADKIRICNPRKSTCNSSFKAYKFMCTKDIVNFCRRLYSQHIADLLKSHRKIRQYRSKPSSFCSDAAWFNKAYYIFRISKAVQDNVSVVLNSCVLMHKIQDSEWYLSFKFLKFSIDSNASIFTCLILIFSQIFRC